MHAAIFGKVYDNSMMSPLQSLVDLLRDRGSRISFHQPFFDACCINLKLPAETSMFRGHSELLALKPDVLFSLGGDGTMLQTITLVRDSGIPVLGINTGRMGFLSNTPSEKVRQAIDSVFAGEYELDSRSLLHLDSEEGLFGDTPFALNEFSVYAANARSLIVVKVWLNGEFLNAYWADGLLIATPTGSTAYSLSCHGPIVSPGSGTFIINPIASHNLSVRPVVIPDASLIKVKISGREKNYIVGLDSRTVSVPAETELMLTRERFKVNFVKLPGEEFFNTVRQKLLWGLDVRN